MRNLVSAGFHRFWKSKIFWIGMAAMLVFSVILAFAGKMRQTHAMTLDEFYFQMAPIIGLFFAVFSSFFIGTEYSDGTMRNKIIAGRTRAQIYLSNYGCCLMAGLCFVAVWFISGLAGIPFFGLWRIGVRGFLLYTLIAVFFTAALTGIFTMLCMLSSNKAVTAAAAILLYLGLLWISATIYNSLYQEEFLSGMRVTADGLLEAMPAETPNPRYISGAKRMVFQFITDCLPSGQSILMVHLEIGRPILSLVSSAVIALTTILAGIWAFRRKDLK